MRTSSSWRSGASRRGATAAGLIPTGPPGRHRSPSADTALLLGVIDTSGGRDVALDTDGSDALRRLQTEWHIAIYGEKSGSSDALLSSYLY
ncbi:hypothetical protein [Amycolatopsis sp. cmx-11-32]|uniref:hypothetical protein n=1 Tax=Amycolatopsis sp. cmx-11-32 TaxID=2785796 RepID=UPI0039E27E23